MKLYSHRMVSGDFAPLYETDLWAVSRQDGRTSSYSRIIPIRILCLSFVRYGLLIDMDAFSVRIGL